MKKVFRISILGLILLLVGDISLSAQSAADIVKKMDQVVYSPKNMKGKNKIILIDKNGKEEVREAIVNQLGNNKRLMRFTAPASQAGISVLSLPNDVMYLYLPAYGKERRIASSAKNQNFAGTDFCYDDMEFVQFSDKYNSKMLSTEKDVFIIELTPKAKSDYSKLIIHINKEHYYNELIQYFDKAGNKFKEAHYHFTKVGNYWSASEIVMTDLKKNHTTKMQMYDVQYDTNLTDDDFTVRKLVE